MTYAFDLRFDETSIPLPTLIENLADLLEERGYVLQSVSPIISSRGRPTVDLKNRSEIVTDDVRAVESQVRGFWGFNLFCTSKPLIERFGRSDNSEVDFAVFNTSHGLRTLKYKESRTVFRQRTQDDDAARELYRLQLRIMSSLGFSVSVYDEELAPLASGPFATLHEAEKVFVRANDRRNTSSVAVSASRLSFAEAQKLAKSRPEDVKLTSNGYVLGQFLHE